ERVGAGLAHGGVLFKVPLACKERSRIVSLRRPVADIVEKRLQAGAAGIRVTFGVPRRVEQAGARYQLARRFFLEMRAHAMPGTPVRQRSQRIECSPHRRVEAAKPGAYQS